MSPSTVAATPAGRAAWISIAGALDPVAAGVRADRRAAHAVDPRARYAPGDRLPPERELAQQLGVSRPSVREAMIALETAGVIEVRTGSGTYVAGSRRRRSISAAVGDAARCGPRHPRAVPGAQADRARARRARGGDRDARTRSMRWPPRSTAPRRSSPRASARRTTTTSSTPSSRSASRNTVLGGWSAISGTCARIRCGRRCARAS